MAHRGTKAPRIKSMADKVCLNGHKGDWIARGGYDQAQAYCVSCAKESLARHKEKKAGIESPRIRAGYLPNLASKQAAEERWARSVLNSAPIQMEMLYERLNELAEVAKEANSVLQNTNDKELLAFALEQIKKMSAIAEKK